jgi:ATP/maltotriose-dependent transcriptional regulator MalT
VSRHFTFFNGTEPTFALATESFGSLVRWPPDTVQLAMSTAAPARGPIAAVRADGRFGELTEADLRFTDAEAMNLMRLACGASMSPALARQVNVHNHGWAAGLRLTAPAPARAVRAAEPSGDQAGSLPPDPIDEVADYLWLEVLDRLAPGHRAPGVDPRGARAGRRKSRRNGMT